MIEPAAGCAVLTYDGLVVPYVRAHRGSKRTNRYAAAYFACKEAMGWAWRLQWGRREPLGKGFAVTLDMVIVVPVAKLWTQDADNLGKAISDSLIGPVLVDDRFVTAFHVRKEPARPIVGIEPGAWVEITWEVKDGGVSDGGWRD